MTENGVSEKVKNFIFLYVGSVELIEVLMIFESDEKRSWSATSLADEMRSNPNSVATRISCLKSLGLVREKPGSTLEYLLSQQY